MKKMKKTIKVIGTLLGLLMVCGLLGWLTGLIHINGSGYADLTPEQRQRVLKCHHPIDEVRNDGNLYQINHQQVADLIKRKHNVVVYLYLPFCSSEDCISPIEAERVCTQKGYYFCLVGGVYDGLEPLQGSSLKAPILVIDHTFYHTDNYQHYCREFEKLLTGQDYDQRGFGAFHTFAGGAFKHSYDKVSQIPALAKPSSAH